jgi:hypothetical protein
VISHIDPILYFIRQGHDFSQLILFIIVSIRQLNIGNKGCAERRLIGSKRLPFADVNLENGFND